MLAVPGEREICETQWRVRLTERAPYAQQLDADGRLTILEEKSAAGSVRRAADEIWGAGGYLLYAQELSAKADGVQGMQRLCQALRRADDAIQSYFYDGALREGAAFDDRPEQKEAEQFNRAYAERITTAILLGKKDYLTALLRDYWQDLLKAYPEGNPRCLKRGRGSR